MTRLRILLLGISLVLPAVHAPNTFAAGGPSGSLAFGWATESITPPGPVAIAGQYHTRISGDVHDPITVTALALETRDAGNALDQALWVSCDLVGIRRRSTDRIRSLIRGGDP